MLSPYFHTVSLISFLLQRVFKYNKLAFLTIHRFTPGLKMSSQFTKMVATMVAAVAAVAVPVAALAQNASNAWSNAYNGGGLTRHQVNMNQADLIGKREAGYYDNIGKNVFNTSVVTTNTYGSYVDSTTTITGDGNAVGVGATNSGSLNGSVNWTTGGSTTTNTNNTGAPQ